MPQRGFRGIDSVQLPLFDRDPSAEREGQVGEGFLDLVVRLLAQFGPLSDA